MSFCLKRSSRHIYWNNFKKKLFSLKKFAWTSRVQVWQTCIKKFAQWTKQFFPESKKVLKNNLFSKKDIFPLKISNVQKIPKFFFNEMFRSKKILFSKKFFRKCRVQIWQPCRKKSFNIQKCLVKIRRSRWKKLKSKSVYKKNSSFKKVSQKKFLDM